MVKYIFLWGWPRFPKLVLAEPCQHLLFPQRKRNNQHHWIKKDSINMKASVHICLLKKKKIVRGQESSRSIQKPLILCACLETQSPPFSSSELRVGRTSRVISYNYLMLQMTQLMHRKNKWLAQHHTVSHCESWGISIQCGVPSSQELNNWSFSWYFFILLAWHETWSCTS